MKATKNNTDAKLCAKFIMALAAELAVVACVGAGIALAFIALGRPE